MRTRALVTATDLRRAVSTWTTRFDPETLVLDEVRAPGPIDNGGRKVGGGGSGDRAIDVFSIVPFGRFLRRAFELKCDRGDLVRELETPEKREPWLELVHEFYLVTPDGMTSREEIDERAPECGLLVFDPEKYPKVSGGLVIEKHPIKLDGSEPDWRLVISIMRAAGIR